MLAELVITCIPWIGWDTVCMDKRTGEFWKVESWKAPVYDEKEIEPTKTITKLEKIDEPEILGKAFQPKSIKEHLPPSKKSDLIPLSLGMMFDLGTTEIGTHKGFNDHNPIANSRILMYGGKAVQLYFIDKSIKTLRKKGKKNSARFVKGLALVANFGAGFYNLHQIYKK